MSQVLILEDHLLFADSLKALLTQRLKLKVDVCNRIDKVLSNIHRLNSYDLVFVDLKMPDINGFHFLQACQNLNINCLIIVISCSVDHADIERSFTLGAKGYIPKDSNMNDFINGVQAVFNGKKYISEQFCQAINPNTFLPPQEHSKGIIKGDLKITEIQQKVLEMVQDGLRNKQIALVLGISESGVKFHIEALLKKLKVKNRASCVSVAINQELLEQKS